MDHTAQGLLTQRRAFCVDMHGDMFLGGRHQDSAAATELRLQQRLMPASAHLQVQAAAAGATAIADFLQENLPRDAAVLARLRHTRRSMYTASLAVGARMLGGRPVGRAALMFADNSWHASQTPSIMRVGMEVATSAIRGGQPLDIQCSPIVNGILSFQLGLGSSAMLGVATCTAAAVETPLGSGVMEGVMEAMDHHAQSNPDVRFAWAIVLGPGCARVCLLEHGAIHVSAVQYTAHPAGCRLLSAAVAHAGGKV
ncbi:hypothetical protein GGI08_002371, partial [Coemansia sp. S2]